MADDLARRTHAVFVGALDLDGPARDEFVASRCAGDPALESRVRRLLEAVPRSTDFLETPALATHGLAEADAPPPDLNAVRIRGYRLTRVIGSGGMATVYEAEQEQPRRTVALKVMHRSLASTSAVRRFRYETEVLARLRHPGIAQIYEAGTCDDGTGRALPFFAMELVPQARTIVEHAEARGLGLRERLALLAEACDAVQHGHLSGVIHRDLKPANILVDDDGRVKVIDFGIARPTDPDDAGVTQRGDAGQLIGTLNTMSPEQCAGASVDARADVYALGVVLYELVSGTLPHELGGVSIPEAVRIIAQEPIARLSSRAPAARGDLDAIAAMALEKDPARRYAGAGALAADLRRYLSDQPVEARAPTAAYQLRKFARRHRGVVAAAGAAAVILVAGAASTTWMAYLATKARKAAEQRGAELERVIAFQESQLSGINVREMGERIRWAMEESVRASASEAEHAALLEGLRLIGERANFTTVALRAIDGSVLQRSRAAIGEQFASQPLVQARLLQRLAATMNALGLYEQAEPVLGEALAIRREHLGADHPDTLHSQSTTGALLMSLGRYDEAIAVLEQVYERRVAVQGADDPATLRTATSLGGALRLRGRHADAERVWRATHAAQQRTLGPNHTETLRSLNNIGVILAVQGKLAEAEACWRELLERQRRVLGPGSPELTTTQMNLANALADRGAYDEAVPLLESALATNRRHKGDDHDDTLSAMMNLALVRREMDDLGDAEALLRECLERRERVLGPGNAKTWSTAAMLAKIRRDSGERDSAAALAREALAAQRRLLGDDHGETIETMVILAAILRESGAAEEALELGDEALERSTRAFPEGHWMRGRVLSEQGRTLSALGRWEEAESALRRGLEALTAGAGGPLHARREAAAGLAEHEAARGRSEPRERTR